MKPYRKTGYCRYQLVQDSFHQQYWPHWINPSKKDIDSPKVSNFGLFWRWGISGQNLRTGGFRHILLIVGRGPWAKSTPPSGGSNPKWKSTAWTTMKIMGPPSRRISFSPRKPRRVPGNARSCFVLFLCFVSFFLCVGVFFGIRYLCLVVMHPFGLLVFPLFLSLGTATGTGDHSWQNSHCSNSLSEAGFQCLHTAPSLFRGD